MSDGDLDSYSDDTTPDDGSRILLHLCSEEEWAATIAAGRREPPSLAVDGFVHLSSPGQVHLPATRLFAGRQDLVVLLIDRTRLSAPVVWEPGVPTDPTAMRFPHLYGPLPADAVVDVRPYRPGPDGTFAPPAL